ncbi:hypothetical protein A1O1_07367 [Capronia coronata CBS 617.96]|uniref:Hypercellular protein HypA n=1 Tax=Capronia coronata CBS 617.96 TaxID=1182541 RepID=W9Y3C3_9EURO|nr:uncharacterized protein A1O1_07367 [Capronia coronata CBS 617.96]EXJ83741.1 hypothetical protein A1O1_07367 [Capronia coronata CBS 617.96]
MGYNPFLPTAGARVNVLCIPAGRIAPERFLKFVKLLQNAAIVKANLVDSSQAPDGLHPSSKDGYCIFYDVSATQDAPRAHLFPFETNSRFQVLLGIVDGERVGSAVRASGNFDDTTKQDVLSDLEAIKAGFFEQVQAHPGLLVRQLIYCDKETPTSLDSDILPLTDVDGTDAALDVMVRVSRLLMEGIVTVVEDFREQPISMVPGANTPTFARTGNTPISSSASSSSTPVKSASPRPPSNDAEIQSETSRGRFKVIQGMYHLQGGLWNDAMDSLSEGASIAQNGHDHLWHGRALECLLLCMLLLSWSDRGFTVPQVCRSLPNRSVVFQTESSSTPSDSQKALARLMPPIVETILELYARVSNLDLGGSLQDVLREARVRNVNILVFVKRNGGVLNRECLDRLVLSRTETEGDSLPSEGEPVAISKAGLANILIETLQACQASNSSTHPTSILVAVASSLSLLGLNRKHAFYLRQLMQQFVHKLIEARKIGAAEAGIHPAAGLPPVNNAPQGILPEMVLGIRSMLSLASGAYGVPLPAIPTPRRLIPADLGDIDAKLRVWAAEHSSGELLLKIEMLRTCVGVSEALPDVPTGLYLASAILRVAKQSVTMSKQLNTAPPLISADGQLRLLDSIKRGVSVAPRLGAPGYRAEYWDDFLVRDIQVFEQDDSSKLISHKPSDLSVRGSGLTDTIRDPFIYNPFSKSTSAVAAPVLVAGELAMFAVLLQNPMEVEVEIEDISLVTKGCGFNPSHHSIVLGPLSIQVFTLTGTPTEDGDLEVVGCKARVRNCYEQEFLIFRDEWKPSLNIKQNAVGRVRHRTSQAKHAGDDTTRFPTVEINPPIATPVNLKVIRAQPRIRVQSNSLGRSAIMLLEGESRVFDLNLVNESPDVPADFILVTAQDSVTSRLKEALSNKGLNPAEQYEIQNQLSGNPAVAIRRKGPKDSTKILEPGKVITYEVTIVGQPGLVSATVQADYAYLGSASTEVKGTFYTRQVRFPIAITVNGSVEIPRCNILPVHSDFAWMSGAAPNGTQDETGAVQTGQTDASRLSHWLQTSPQASDYCMLSLDLRNVWPQPLEIDIRARNAKALSASPEEPWQDAYTVLEALQPGHVTRVVLLVPRLFIEDLHAQVPNLETQKQFVVTTSKLSAEAEAASRESFWYREELLKCLRGTWTEESSGRHGEIDLRKGIRLSPRMVDALKMDHVDFEYVLRPCDEEADKSEAHANTAVKQIGRSHFNLKPETFATLSVKVHNHTQDTLPLLLRLQPALRHQPHNIALDLSRRFAWSGVLQRALHPAIEPGGTCVAELGVIALVQGEYEITTSVEEVKARRVTGAAKGGGASAARFERRIWHARSPCLIDAVEE